MSEVRVNAQGGLEGQKFDLGKPPIYRGILLQFPNAIAAAAGASEYGSRKYSWDNWSRVSDGIERYSDAMLRHLLEEGQGKVVDPDSGLPIVGHTLWNALARTELILRNKTGD